MKFLKNIEVIILMLTIIIIATIIASRLIPTANLSPKLTPKCVFEDKIITAESRCSPEDALTKKPCTAKINGVVGTCKYYS